MNASQLSSDLAALNSVCERLNAAQNLAIEPAPLSDVWERLRSLNFTLTDLPQSPVVLLEGSVVRPSHAQASAYYTEVVRMAAAKGVRISA